MMSDDFSEIMKLLGIPAQRNEAILSLCMQLENIYRFATLTDTRELHIYTKAKDLYEKQGEVVIERELQKYCPSITNEAVKNVIEKIKMRNFVERGSFDADPELLHASNGWLNIRTKEFAQPSQERFSFTKLGIAYDKDAKNPIQQQFFEDVFEEEDLPVVQKFFGYLLLQDNRYKKAFSLVGPKDTGKSKFLELVERFAGSVSHVSLHDMAARAHNVAGITRSIVNTTSELPKYKLKDVSLFKSITGNDESSFRDIFERPFNARVRSKFVMASNDLPDFDGMDQTFIDRWIVFRCNNVFVKGENMKPDIINEITTDAEMSGLLNYALEGLEKLLHDGYFKDENYAELREKWQGISSKISDYANKYLVFEKEAKIPSAGLHIHYSEIMKKDALSERMFGRELKQLGVKKEREPSGKRAYFYKGVKLKDGQALPCDDGDITSF